MRKIVLFLFITSCFSATIRAQADSKIIYISTNVLSPFAGINKNSATLNALLPLFSNLEYGPNINIGLIKNWSAFESRITAGSSNPYNFIPQIQLSYNFFVTDYIKRNNNGLYVGAHIKAWDLHNINTDTHLYNFTQGIDGGYLWKKSRFLVDFRISQQISILSFSNISNSKPAFDFATSPMPLLSPVLPFLCLNVGCKLN